MAYRKRGTSDAFDKLAYRFHAMKTINPTFNLGSGLQADEIDELVSGLRSHLHEYNETLSDADDLRTTIEQLERKANDVSQRLLSAVLGRFGQDSYEYRRVGGTRKSQIIPTGSEPRTFQPEDTNGTTTSSTGSGTGSSSTTT